MQAVMIASSHDRSPPAHLPAKASAGPSLHRRDLHRRHQATASAGSRDVPAASGATFRTTTSVIASTIRIVIIITTPSAAPNGQLIVARKLFGGEIAERRRRRGRAHEHRREVVAEREDEGERPADHDAARDERELDEEELLPAVAPRSPPASSTFAGSRSIAAKIGMKAKGIARCVWVTATAKVLKMRNWSG